MRVQGARASPGSPRIQTVIRADPRKADEKINNLLIYEELRRVTKEYNSRI
jgi:hypothetical protein